LRKGALILAEKEYKAALLEGQALRARWAGLGKPGFRPSGLEAGAEILQESPAGVSREPGVTNNLAMACLKEGRLDQAETLAREAPAVGGLGALPAGHLGSDRPGASPR